MSAGQAASSSALPRSSTSAGVPSAPVQRDRSRLARLSSAPVSPSLIAASSIASWNRGASSDFTVSLPARVATLDPEARLVPIVMSGFSDSHWFRKAFDAATVYGFCPQRKLGLFEAAPLIHSADERAAITYVELAASFYADVCKRVLR